MTTTTTATVQTLAAEVRVLKFGSRQITLSVFKQLDVKPLDEVDVFGRVRTDNGSDSVVRLVGRHRDTGDLVRSAALAPNWTTAGPAEFYHWLFHNYVRLSEQARKNGYRLTAASVEGRTLSYSTLNEGGRIECKKPAGSCDTTELERSWREHAVVDLALMVHEANTYAAAQAQPLIVLAGLR